MDLVCIFVVVFIIFKIDVCWEVILIILLDLMFMWLVFFGFMNVGLYLNFWVSLVLVC